MKRKLCVLVLGCIVLCTGCAKDDLLDALTDLFHEHAVENDLLTYIPDDNFERLLISYGYDDVLDDYVLTSNISEVTELNITGHDGFINEGLPIYDITGIEDFKNLVHLELYWLELMLPVNLCEYNQLESLRMYHVSTDEQMKIRSNPRLITTHLQYTSASELDISSNNNLEGIQITEQSYFENMYIHDNPKLTSYFSWEAFALNNQEIYNNPVLESFRIEYYSKAPANFRFDTGQTLKNLHIINYNLQDFDVTNYPNLEKLYLPMCKLTSLDISNNIALKEIDLSSNPQLTCIKANEDQIDFFTNPQNNGNGYYFDFGVGVLRLDCSAP